MFQRPYSSFVGALSLYLLSACPADDVGVTGGESESESESTSTGDGSTTTLGTQGTSTTGEHTSTGTTESPTGTTTESLSDSDSDTGSSGSSGSTGASDSDTGSTGGDPTMCDRLGGADGLSSLHTNLLGMVLLDERINAYFLNAPVDGDNLISCLNDQIGEAIECPGVVYACKSMASAHEGMGISAVDFADLAEDYSAALDLHQAENPAVTDDDKAAIMAELAAMEADIVEDPDGVQTVYQRLGRKPALKGLIGGPELDDSFLNVVSGDEMINGFFTGADFVRLATCFTRQLGSIDGPVQYSMEVDSPGQGVDEGVSADTPCADMLSSHAGLTDSKDDSLITMLDFTQVLQDMVTAMDVAGIPDGDQLTILGVLGPLCEEIVGDHPNECPGNNETMTVGANGLNLAIPDDAYNGTKGSMTCTSLEVADNGINFVDDVELKIGIDHPWLGDLVIKLYSPDGTAITVLSRSGYIEAADDGGGISVEGSDLESGAPITFAMDGPYSAETLGDGNNLNNAGVACKDDGRCEYEPNSGKAVPGTLSDLAGESALGFWDVCVGDAGSADKGSLVNVTLKIRKVKLVP